MNLAVGDVVKVNWAGIRFKARITQVNFSSVKFNVLGEIRGKFDKKSGFNSYEETLNLWWTTVGDAFKRVSPLELLAEAAE